MYSKRRPSRSHGHCTWRLTAGRASASAAAQVNLVLYGSFNCPDSYVASLRTDRLRAAGAAQIESRGVGAPARLAELEGMTTAPRRGDHG